MHWTLLDSSEVPEEFDDEHHHHTLAFEHCSEAYEVFLSGVDDYSPQERALEARYSEWQCRCPFQVVITKSREEERTSHPGTRRAKGVAERGSTGVHEGHVRSGQCLFQNGLVHLTRATNRHQSKS